MEDSEQQPSVLITRPLHSKIFFTLTLTSLSFTVFALYRIFRSTKLAQPLESVKWQRFRMIGQAGIIGGLTGPLVFEGLGFDTWKLRAAAADDNDNDIVKQKEINKNNVLNNLLNFSLGLFARNTETIYK